MKINDASKNEQQNSFKEMGKTPGKDKKQGKRTLLSVLGGEKAIRFLEKWQAECHGLESAELLQNLK